ncbi:uro-adherence factor A [Penaeus vannamei]|uniref:uro-adherence factor A n=1 Tax=Penaeus vannamei TaxID=6689 RepID=UPI00387F88B2
MDSSLQRELDDTTPRTSLRQQLKVLPPQETPVVLKEGHRERQAKRKDATSPSKASPKRAKGNAEATNLHNQVLRQRLQLSRRSLDQSLNISNIKGTNQTYADLSISDSGDSFTKESIDLETAARFRKKRTRALESVSQPELPVGALMKKTSSMDQSLRSLRSNTSLASQTYADLSLLASDESSLSESINLEKVTRFRKRSKPLASASQPELSSKIVAKKPTTGKKAGGKMESSVFLSTDKTYGAISDSLLESSNDSINLEAARKMRYRSRREKVVLSQPNPDLPPLVTPKKGKGSSRQNMSPKWKSPERFTSRRGKEEKRPDSPVAIPSTKPTSHLDNTYDLDSADESLENVKAATRRRFGRKAPPVELNLTALMKNLKKSELETVEDEEEEKEREEKQPSETESTTLQEDEHMEKESSHILISLDSSSENSFDDQDSQASQAIRAIPESQDNDGILIPETQESVREGQGVDTPNSYSSETEDLHEEQAEGGVTSIPDTQEEAEGGVTSIPETQKEAEGGETSIPETQEEAEGGETSIPETQEEAEGGETSIPETQKEAQGGETSIPETQEEAEGGETSIPETQEEAEGGETSIPETQESNASAGAHSTTKELIEKEDEYPDQLSPPLNFRDADEEHRDNEASEIDHTSFILDSDDDKDKELESNISAPISTLEGSPDRNRSSAGVSDMASSPLRKSMRLHMDKTDSPQKSLESDAKFSEMSLGSQVQIESKSQLRARSSLGETTGERSSPRSARKSLPASFSQRLAGLDSKSPRKSVGMLYLESNFDKDLQSGSPWKDFKMKNALVKLTRLDESTATNLSPAGISRLKTQSPSEHTIRTPHTESKELPPSGSPRPNDVSLSKKKLFEGGKSKMATQKAKMHTVTIEAEVHPEEAIKAATRASPGMLAVVDSQEEQESVGSINEEVQDELSSPKSKSRSPVLIQDADAVDVPAEEDIEEFDGVTSIADNNSSKGDDPTLLKKDLEEIVNEETRLASPQRRKMFEADATSDRTIRERSSQSTSSISEEATEPAVSDTVEELTGKESQAQRSNVRAIMASSDLGPAATASQTDESDEEEEFLLPTLLRRKSVMPEMEAEMPDESLDTSNDVSLGEYREVSIRVPDLDNSQAAVNKQVQGTSEANDHTSSIHKATLATIASNPKQMTMKEFLEKLAAKPMQAPVPTKQEGPRLASLLKYTKPQTPRKVSLRRPKADKNPKKELPKRLSKAATRDLFSHFAKCRLTPDGLNQLLKVSEEYWKNCCSDLANFVAARGGVKEVQAKDVKKLMKRQGLMSSEEDLQILVQKYLPAEEWNHLIPTAYAKGNIYPLPPDS